MCTSPSAALSADKGPGRLGSGHLRSPKENIFGNVNQGENEMKEMKCVTLLSPLIIKALKGLRTSPVIQRSPEDTVLQAAVEKTKLINPTFS